MSSNERSTRITELQLTIPAAEGDITGWAIEPGNLSPPVSHFQTSAAFLRKSAGPQKCRDICCSREMLRGTKRNLRLPSAASRTSEPALRMRSGRHRQVRKFFLRSGRKAKTLENDKQLSCFQERRAEWIIMDADCSIVWLQCFSTSVLLTTILILSFLLFLSPSENLPLPPFFSVQKFSFWLRYFGNVIISVACPREKNFFSHSLM